MIPNVDILLNDVEARVLGSLIEKEITTPDYYPLSLNALVNACNQKSNRDPVMNLDEETVRQALDDLNQKGLAGASSHADSRVTKYEHRLQEVFNFTRPETAILCVLLLRGHQTPGELRGRAERMHRFDDLSQVESTLHRLIEHDPPLVKILPRQPGTKESRYAHLFSGDVAAPEPQTPGGPMEAGQAVVQHPLSESQAFRPAEAERIARLEDEVAQLRQEIADLKQRLEDFRKQFE